MKTKKKLINKLPTKASPIKVVKPVSKTRGTGTKIPSKQEHKLKRQKEFDKFVEKEFVDHKNP